MKAFVCTVPLVILLVIYIFVSNSLTSWCIKSIVTSILWVLLLSQVSKNNLDKEG